MRKAGGCRFDSDGTRARRGRDDDNGDTGEIGNKKAAGDASANEDDEDECIELREREILLCEKNRVERFAVRARKSEIEKAVAGDFK